MCDTTLFKRVSGEIREREVDGGLAGHVSHGTDFRSTSRRSDRPNPTRCCCCSSPSCIATMWRRLEGLSRGSGLSRPHHRATWWNCRCLCPGLWGSGGPIDGVVCMIGKRRDVMTRAETPTSPCTALVFGDRVATPSGVPQTLELLEAPLSPPTPRPSHGHPPVHPAPSWRHLEARRPGVGRTPSRGTPN